jgi:hypothetical protein
VVIVLSVRSWFKTSLITPLLSWSLCCLSVLDLRLLITPLLSWSLCCLSVLDLRLVWLLLYYRGQSRTDRQYNDNDNKGVIRSLKSRTDRQYNDHDNKGVIRSLKYYRGHCIVCPSVIYGFWLSLWCLAIHPYERDLLWSILQIIKHLSCGTFCYIYILPTNQINIRSPHMPPSLSSFSLSHSDKGKQNGINEI